MLLSHSALPLCESPCTSLLHLLISSDRLHLSLPAVFHRHSSACQYISSASSLTHCQIVSAALMTLQHFSLVLTPWFQLRMLLTTSPRLCPGKANSPPSLSASSVCVLPSARLPVAVWRFTAPASSSEIACSPTFRLSTTTLLPAVSEFVCSARLPVADLAPVLTLSPACSSTASLPWASGCVCLPFS